jgi:hypothetical protein
MSTWAVVFLGVIALASLVQATILVVLVLESRKLARRVDQLQDRWDRELKYSLEHLERIARNFAEVSDLAVLGARRVNEGVADVMERVEETTSLVRRMLIKPLQPLVDIAAFVKGLRRGISVYQQLRGIDGGSKRPARSYSDAAEDEHLFI